MKRARGGIFTKWLGCAFTAAIVFQTTAAGAATLSGTVSAAECDADGRSVALGSLSRIE